MYNQGDIVLVPVPFSDLSNQKQRPVLVISNNIYNIKTEDIVVLAITSKVKEQEYSIMLESKDLISGELKVTSEIRADKIYTLSKTLIRRKFGQVNSNVIDKARMKLNKLI